MFNALFSLIKATKESWSVSGQYMPVLRTTEFSVDLAGKLAKEIHLLKAKPVLNGPISKQESEKLAGLERLLADLNTTFKDTQSKQTEIQMRATALIRILD